VGKKSGERMLRLHAVAWNSKVCIIFHCGISMKITYGNITTLNFFHCIKRVLSIGEQHLQNTYRSENPSEPNHPINDLA
jgi:hypothetical protein